MKSKRKIIMEETEVNVVPLMDILTTMLFFLILMASTSNFSALIGKSAPIGSSAEEDKPKFDLVVHIKSPKRAEIYLADITKLRVIDKSSFQSYLSNKYSNRGKLGRRKTIKSNDIVNTVQKIQKELIRIKQAFPHEMGVTLIVSNRIKYQELITSMDAIANIRGQDKAFKLENFIGQIRLSTTLFPEILIQESGEDHAS